MNAPISVNSVSNRSHRVCKAGIFSGGTASTMRSCASDSQISQGARPGYFRRTLFNSTSQPSLDAISPTAEDRPPAPQSVMSLYRHRSRARTMTSIRPISVIGSPICTEAPETSPVCASIVMDEKVAPRRPSRPVRPPSTMTRSPTCGFLRCFPLGAMPTQPQKTSGLAV